MSFQPTLRQSGDETRKAQELSLPREQPPGKVQGYNLERFLGAGAYGEVWVATDRKTGRCVAIKFYTHQGGLDWGLLSREVEKLRFLFADRYVVQLLDVGWDADPPYYVMEYLEHGSLEDRLAAGPLPLAEAVAVFRDVAIGLVHAHGKGVLHCDLKPANVLLDQDAKPRLADFGQSRLSHEQTRTLGTLFYMAPEQADLKAVPDARWDVYALGALLFRMLVGKPPYRTPEIEAAINDAPDLETRLARYRHAIAHSPRPVEHRQAIGVDRAMEEIIDRCLVADPKRRYPNVQAVLDALESRQHRHARRPLLVLGALGPALLLLVMTWFAWSSFDTALGESERLLTERALESSRFAARLAAEAAGTQIERHFRQVSGAAEDRDFRELMTDTVADPEIRSLLAELQRVDRLMIQEVRRLDKESPAPRTSPELAALKAEFHSLQQRFLEHPARQPLQRWLENVVREEPPPKSASWVVLDSAGTSLARVPEIRQETAGENVTIGENWSWRTYFHGGDDDFHRTYRAEPGQHIKTPNLSAVFRSSADNRWVASVSAPIPAAGEGFQGVLHQTVQIGAFVDLTAGEELYTVLVDWRSGPSRGLILQHPLFEELLKQSSKLPVRFDDPAYRLTEAILPDTPEKQLGYEDPIARDAAGAKYRGPRLATMEPVQVRGQDMGLRMIVQEDQQAAMHPIRVLGMRLVARGLQALAVVSFVITALWGFVIVVLNESPRFAFIRSVRRRVGLGTETMTPTTGSGGTARLSGGRGPVTPGPMDEGGGSCGAPPPRES
jgi:serine/threonine protein kinase